MGCSMCTSSADKEKTAAERKAAWARLKQRLPTKRTPEDKQRRIDLFKKMDTNNSGRLTCDEVYAGCVRELSLDEFTNRLRDVVKRAFNKSKSLGNTEAGQGSEDYVEFLEFRLMLCYIYDYCELTVMFDEIDDSGNMLLTEKEFEKAVPKIEEWGLKINDAKATFKEVDADGSGQVTFDEFCNWAAAKKLDIGGDPDA